VAIYIAGKKITKNVIKHTLLVHNTVRLLCYKNKINKKEKVQMEQFFYMIKEELYIL
jgi:hypothetical protein